MEVAHRLHRRDANQSRRPEDHHCGRLLEDAVGEDSQGKSRQLRFTAFLRDAPKKPEKEERSNCAEPLVPRPSIEKEVGTRLQRFSPDRGRRLENPTERDCGGQRIYMESGRVGKKI